MKFPWPRLRNLVKHIDESSSDEIKQEVQASRREAEKKLAVTAKETIEISKVANQSRKLRMQNEFGRRIAESYARRPKHG